MGTSASNGGPTGSPPLLPDWFNPNPPEREQNEQQPETENNDLENDTANNDQQEEQSQDEALEQINPLNQSKDWGKSKGALTRLSNARSGASIRKAGKNYVNSLGGSRGATRAAVQGVITGKNYANFLGSIAEGGIANALQGLGIDEFIGRTSEEVCIAIANALAPIGATNDEAIAREALISTLDSLYGKMQEEGSDFTSISQLNLEQIKDTLIEFVSNYIFNKWMYELGGAIERGDVTEREVINLEIQVKDFIRAETIERYRDIPIETFNLNDRVNYIIIEEIFQTAYSTLE
ncbi:MULTISPECIES: Qat anti-phage system associated protein QatB [unclassified Chryseobacterium]|uniref:Qat anti-phage system associated protein QatB n=1 Tax=unclassified Chryseobacterium TaxID=2593645 RepID=UPI0028532CC6|nr:Qat anti-phage system associated protein QatB [Chryseobacterium sp. CFS7]MDR4891598.1 Qat anti-phage system associated protein QatB [Chryseobacterium sp. CFS7]